MTNFGIFIGSLVVLATLAAAALFVYGPKGTAETRGVIRSTRAIAVGVVLVCLAVIAAVISIIWHAVHTGHVLWS